MICQTSKRNSKIWGEKNDENMFNVHWTELYRKKQEIKPHEWIRTIKGAT